MIRITGGLFKGRKIKSPKNTLVRPALTTIRKVLFDTLGDKVEGSRFMDVFCGTGSIGIEALSRKASLCVFVDINPQSIKIAKENIRLLNIEENTVFIKANALKPPALITKLSPFDIIFLGPPYNFKKINVLPTIYAEFLDKEGVIIIQHHHKTGLDIVPGFSVKTKRVGENQLTFFYRERME